MYQVDVASIRSARVARASGRPRIPQTVWLLGLVSCVTDVSSEMVSSILPAYLLVQLQYSPLAFGFIDGLYQGVSAIARLASGVLADRWQRYKAMAAAGYGLSAICKLGLLASGGSSAAIAAVISLDRTGKGIRTAPRDALISLSATEDDLGAAFGVHRALDTAGVVIGPLMAFLILRAAPGAYDAVFVASFAAAIIGLGVLVLLVDEHPGRRVDQARTSLRDAVGLARDARFRTVLVAGTLLSATVMSDAFLYLMLLRKIAGLSDWLPLFYIGTACAFLALALPIGRLADRIGRARVFVGGHLIVIAVYAAAVGFDLGIGGLVVCLALHGAYYAATDGVLPALASAIVPADRRATGLATVATGTSLAKLVGSIALGALWSWKGPSAVLVFGLAGTALTILWAATVLPALDSKPVDPAGA
jgi:MFS family permease